MVKQVVMQDTHNYLLLTAGQLHDLETIRQLAPKTPLMFRPRETAFATPEEATAWVATARCRRLAYSRSYEPGDGNAAVNMALQTWVLGPAQAPDALMAGLFGERGLDQDRRILVHRTPRAYEGRPVRPCWMAGYIGRSKVVRQRIDLGRDDVKTAEAALAQLLVRCASGSDAVNGLFATSGLPYWSSDGRANTA